MFLQSAILKSDFDNDFIFFLLLHIRSVIRKVEGNLQDVDVEVV